MRATVLVDNTDGNGMRGEHGLSLYIENARAAENASAAATEGFEEKTEKQSTDRILLDTGMSDLFAENAAALGINLSDVDLMVLSHGHYDHSTGTGKFFELNASAKMYLRPEAVEEHYHIKNRTFEYNGIPKDLVEKYSDRMIFVDGKSEIIPGVWLLPHNTEGLEEKGRKNGLYAGRKTVLDSGGEVQSFVPDDFRHEQTLVIEDDDKLIVFSSCSHAGPDVIIREVREAFPGKVIRFYVGGFHCTNMSFDEVEKLAGKLNGMPVEKYFTGHCTGMRAYEILKSRLGEKVAPLCCGTVIET